MHLACHHTFHLVPVFIQSRIYDCSGSVQTPAALEHPEASIKIVGQQIMALWPFASTSPSFGFFLSSLFAMATIALALLAPLLYTNTNALPIQSNEGPAWQPYGCYTDNVAARTLSGAELVSESMTTATCQAFCFSKGYKYAGTEWSRECFCDNEFRNGGVRTNEGCVMKCTGAADEVCGGDIHLTVYENTGSLSPPPLNYVDWESKGCYTDSVANRALPNQVYIDGDMTADKCMSKCFSLGYPLAGVEFARECFCGSSIGSSGIPVTIGCDMQCTGNANEICGGANRLNIFQYTTTPSPLPSSGGWSLYGETGCYTDVVANRALGLRVYVDGAMTVPKCTEKCFSLKYGYAGVEYADECYCSHSIGSSGMPAEDGCTMPCTGDLSTICGGPDRVNIYEYQGKDFPAGATVLASYKEFSSQGCYTDSVQARIMNQVGVDDQMTVETCIDTCIAAGYHVAGVEYGNECYCSATLPVESAKATDNCIMSCAGDSGHLCGGPNRLNVYQYQVPGSTSTELSESNAETPTSTTSNIISTSTDTTGFQTAAPTIILPHWDTVGCITGWDPSTNSKYSMKFGPYLSTTMCENQCIHRAPGSWYASVRDGWCYCYETEPLAPYDATSDACNTPCPSDPRQMCGGTSSATVLKFTPPSLPTPGSYNDWTYVGCGEGTFNWDIRSPRTSLTADTPAYETCLDYCGQNGSVAALQDTLCLCLSSIPGELTYGSDLCLSTVGTNPLEIVGTADWQSNIKSTFQVFQRVASTSSTTSTPTQASTSASTDVASTQTSVPLSPPFFAELGCSSDIDLDSAPVSLPLGDDLSHQLCGVLCTYYMATYAALNQGVCYCFDQEPTATFNAGGSCNTHCPGNSDTLNESCGGSGREATVLRYSPPPRNIAFPQGWSSLGCAANVLLPSNPETVHENMPEDEPAYDHCLNFCADKGNYALLIGPHCYCQTAVPEDQTFDSPLCISQYGSNLGDAVGTIHSWNSALNTYQVFVQTRTK